VTDSRRGDAPAPEPQTIAGQAWLSGMRPHHRRAATPLILSIEAEAARPALAALLEADAVLAELAAIEPGRVSDDAVRELINRARAAHDHAGNVLDPTPSSARGRPLT
jgi:hypothetical protein